MFFTNENAEIVVCILSSRKSRHKPNVNVNVNVICLPTEHQGVHKNSFRNVRAFQIELEFGNVGF